jgi:2-polyprenyl-6-methoxyphenol hydroxylase-like FAD-dependent oxidoreductase
MPAARRCKTGPQSAGRPVDVFPQALAASTSFHRNHCNGKACGARCRRGGTGPFRQRGAGMKVLIIGGGVGGLTAAVMCARRGCEVEVYEQASGIRELGVGINTLPHAIRELAGLGLLPALDEVAIRTSELIYTNRFGQEIWREPRGRDAGFDVPQFSIHRGRLQTVMHRAARAAIGDRAIRTGHRLGSFRQDEGGVTAWFFDRDGRHIHTAQGDVLIGADGIHSAVRAALFPGEGPPAWNGIMLWRGALERPTFADGRTMVIAGGMAGKLVVYPIAEGTRPGWNLTNWAVAVKIAAGGPPPRREDWSRPGQLEDVLPHVRGFRLPFVAAERLVIDTPEFYEYPMCDRDPLPRWSHGRVTLMGDAAHPMYPVGSNGASQAILDARALADALVSCDSPQHALWRYDEARRGPTADIVRLNRKGGPERVIDVVEGLAPAGFTDIDAVLPRHEREAIVKGYASTAGFTQEQVNEAENKAA